MLAMSKSGSKKLKYGLLVGIVTLAVVTLGLLQPLVWRTEAIVRQISTENIVNFNDLELEPRTVKYFSDYDYLPGSSAYSFLKDQSGNGVKISIYHDGVAQSFDKGIWAHAPANLYYDLEQIREGDASLGRLMAFAGISTTSGRGNGVTFQIYGTRDDNINTENWVKLYEQNQLPGAAASLVNIDVSQYRLLRLRTDDNGANGNDHSVWADLRLLPNDYNPYAVPLVEELDAEIKSIANLDTLENPDHEILVLRRDLIKNADPYVVTEFLRSGPEYRAVFTWLYNDVDALRMYTTGGKPTGSYRQSLEVLSRLYQAYYATDVENGGADSELYLKMMMALSLTHSKQVRFWIRDQGPIAGSADSPNLSRPLDRYAVYKRMYQAGKLRDIVFTQLEVEEMRYLMFTELGDDELEWVNDWMTNVTHRGPYTYPAVPYVSIGNHYWWDVNYDANYVDPRSGETWTDLYALRGGNYTDGQDKSISGNYFINFVPNAPHLWMINYYGGVCWQISNFGQNMVASFGIPSTTFGQPGHLAYANYELGTSTPGWALTNDVSGWAYSNFTGYTNTNTYHQVRQMNNWGAADGSYSLLNGNRYGYQGSYVLMAQAAINDFDHYEKSQLLTKTAEIYQDDLTRQEQTYRSALSQQDFNFDAWYGLLVNYQNQHKTAAEWYDLATELSNSRVKSFTVPYYDLMKTIAAQILQTNETSTIGYNAATEVLLTQGLEWMAANNTNANIEGIYRQAGITQGLAKFLLGRLNNEVAVFSFDGEEAGVLKLGSKYQDSNAAFDYSLDGGATWSSGPGRDHWVTEKSGIQLSAAELAQITAENDIRVHIQGVDWSHYYTIDIKKGTLPNNLYANDKENRIVGVNTTMDWCEVTAEDECGSGDSKWVSYAASSPLRVGDITIRVRTGYTGVYLPSDPSEAYMFTADNEPETRRYIPVSHLSVAAVSSQATGGGQYGNAIYAIDGNFNTRWHSAWNGSDHDQWIVIKFDHQVELSALGYVAAGGGNGRILQADIYISNDDELKAENFRKVGQVLNDCNNAEAGVLCTSAWPNRDNASIENLNARTFEFRRIERDETGEPVLDDNGQEIVTHAAIPAKYVAIKAMQTSNNGNFIAARMLNFYEDRTQKTAPVAGIAYSPTEPTTGEVIARLINTSEEELEAVDAQGNVIPEGGFEHVFQTNGTYTFYFRRKAIAGVEVDQSIGMAIAKVDWIYDKVAPQPIKVEYICVDDNFDGNDQTADCSAAQGKTNRSISVKLTFPEDNPVRILNNGLQEDFDDDKYDAEAPDPDHQGSNPGDQENGDQISSDQNSLDPFTYLFMRNGSFTFEYEDLAGNPGAYTVKVDWIDKAPPKTAIEYSTTAETAGEVVARLVKVERLAEPVATTADADDESWRYDEDGYEYGEDFVVSNNDGSPEYRFADNGEFTFEYCDAVGNCAAQVAKVDWIKKSEQPDVPDSPNTPDTPDVPDDPNPPVNPDDGWSDLDRPNDDNSSGTLQPDQVNNGNNWQLNPGQSAGNQIADNNIGNGNIANPGQDNDNSENHDSIDLEDGEDNDKDEDNDSQPNRNGGSNSASSNNDKNSQDAEPWYLNPIFLWSVSGAGLLVVLIIIAKAIANRHR